MHDKISLHFGQFGINMAEHVHGKSLGGSGQDQADSEFTYETRNGFKPRAILADLDQFAL